MVCFATCGCEPSTPDDPGGVTVTQFGEAIEPMIGVELTCDGMAGGSVQLTLSIAFTTAYEQAAVGTEFVLGTDLTLTEFTYSVDGGFSSGPGVAVAGASW